MIIWNKNPVARNKIIQCKCIVKAYFLFFFFQENNIIHYLAFLFFFDYLFQSFFIPKQKT
jgi:hypothetical protein